MVAFPFYPNRSHKLAKGVTTTLWQLLILLILKIHLLASSSDNSFRASLTLPQMPTPYTLDHSNEGVLDFGKIKFGKKNLIRNIAPSCYYREAFYKKVVEGLTLRFAAKVNQKHVNEKLIATSSNDFPLEKLATIICTYFSLYYKEDIRRLEQNPTIYARHFISLLKSSYFDDPQRFSSLLRKSYFHYLKENSCLDKSCRYIKKKENMLLADILYIEEKMGLPLLTPKQVEFYRNEIEQDHLFEQVVRQSKYSDPAWSSPENKSIKELLLQLLIKVGKNSFFPEKEFFKKNYSCYLETETMTILALCAKKKQINDFLKDYLTTVIRGLSGSIQHYLTLLEKSRVYESELSFITTYLGINSTFLHQDWKLMKKIFQGYPFSKELVSLFFKIPERRSNQKPVIRILSVEGDFKGISLELDFIQMALAWFEGGDIDYLDPYFKDLCKVWVLKNEEKNKNVNRSQLKRRMKKFIKTLLNEIWENKENPNYKIKTPRYYYRLSQQARDPHLNRYRYKRSCLGYFMQQIFCAKKKSLKNSGWSGSCCSKDSSSIISLKREESPSFIRCSYSCWPEAGGQREVNLCCKKRPVYLRLCVAHCPGDMLCVCQNPYLTLCTSANPQKKEISCPHFLKLLLKKAWWIGWKGCCLLNSSLLKTMCNGFLDCLGFPKWCQKRFAYLCYCEGSGLLAPFIYFFAFTSPPTYLASIDDNLRQLAALLGKNSSFSLKSMHEVDPNPTRLTLRVSIGKERDQLLEWMNAKHSERPHFPHPSIDGIDLVVGEGPTQSLDLKKNNSEKDHLTPSHLAPPKHRTQGSFVILRSYDMLKE